MVKFGGAPRAARGASSRYALIQPTRKDTWLLFVVSLLLYANIFRLCLGLWIPAVYALDYAPSKPPTISQTSAAYSDPSTLVQTEPTASTRSQDCIGNAYVYPGGIDLQNTEPGLTKVIEAPSFYTVFAEDASTLQQQIADCSIRKAVGDYQGYTSYQVSWQYDTVVVSASACRLTNIRVGLHVNQLLPALVTNNAELETRWSSFMQHLTEHEAGHIAIDVRYANAIATSLSSLGTINCAQLSAQAKLAINTQLTLLRSANELYDAETDHGSTQGAVL